MSEDEPAFTVGFEEEYLLVDLETRDVCPDPPGALMRACEDILGSRVAPEFLRCQIEVGTPACTIIFAAGYLTPGDFLKVGWRMVIASTIVMLVAAAVYWPFIGA